MLRNAYAIPDIGLIFKASFGDAETQAKYLKDQLCSYANCFGPGIVIYWFNYLDQILNQKENINVTLNRRKVIVCKTKDSASKPLIPGKILANFSNNCCRNVCSERFPVTFISNRVCN